MSLGVLQIMLLLENLFIALCTPLLLASYDFISGCLMSSKGGGCLLKWVYTVPADLLPINKQEGVSVTSCWFRRLRSCMTLMCLPFRAVVGGATPCCQRHGEHGTNADVLKRRCVRAPQRQQLTEQHQRALSSGSSTLLDLDTAFGRRGFWGTWTKFEIRKINT